MTFKELLLKDNSVTIQVRNLQNFAIEIYKVVSALAIMKQVFLLKDSMRYPSKHISQTRNIHSSPKLWELVPKELNNIKNLNLF